MKRLWVSAAPVVALLLALGCPKSKETASDAVPASSGSLSADASGGSSDVWKSVPIAEPDAADDETDAFGDASDAETSDTTDDARFRIDAKVDAPLSGAATFLDETAIRGLRKVTVTAAKVHKAPKDGTTLATLKRGTEVYLVASLYDWYRVKYVDPTTGDYRQGWIYMMNFAGPPRKDCPEGWVWHALKEPKDMGYCERECNKNTDCRAIKGYKCSGNACFFAAD